MSVVGVLVDDAVGPSLAHTGRRALFLGPIAKVVPPAMLSVPLVAHLRDHLHSKTFDRIVLATLVFSTLVLVIQTFA